MPSVTCAVDENINTFSGEVFNIGIFWLSVYSRIFFDHLILIWLVEKIPQIVYVKTSYNFHVVIMAANAVT